jgi:PAS domain S-box-containing protein
MTPRALFRSPPSARATAILGWLLVGLLLAGAAAAVWAWPDDWRAIAAVVLPVAAVITVAMLLLGAEVRRRETAEAALAAAARRYRAALDSLDEVAFGLDANGRWTALAGGWTDLTGHVVEHSLRRPFLFYVHNDDRPGVIEALQRVVGGESETCRCELRLIGRDGGARWVELFARPAHGDRGEIAGIRGVLRDAAERRATAEALAASERRLEEVTAILQTALAHIAEGVLVIDADRRIPICSERAAELLDLVAEAVELGASFDALSRDFQRLAFGTLDLSPREPDGGIATEMLQVFDRQSPHGRLLALRSAALPQGGVLRIYTDVTERAAEPPAPPEEAGEIAASTEALDPPAEIPSTPAELRDTVVAAFGATLVPDEVEPEASPLFDDEKLAGLRRTYGAAAPRFGMLFRKEAEARLRRIAKLLRAGDAKSLALEAHAMRGAALTFGCRAVQAAADRLEQAAERGAAELLPALIEELNQVFGETRDELAERLRPAA